MIDHARRFNVAMCGRRSGKTTMGECLAIECAVDFHPVGWFAPTFKYMMDAWREIRRMLAQLGHKVHQLKRVAVGNLSLGGLLPGQHRALAWSEVDALRKDAINHVGEIRPAPGPRRPQGRRPDRPDRAGPATGGRGPRKPSAIPGRRRRPGKASSWRKPKSP
jgi:hypothetical protein